MSTHKHFDKICCVVLVIALLLSGLFMCSEQFGVKKASTVMAYEKLLFDNSKVHSINIIMDDWDEFIENCKSEEYYTCTVVIDNEACRNVAIRGKGNTSLSQVTNDRYSFKIEFDHYDSTNTYYGLDKLCLNNIIQDNTYMKDYLCYTMMKDMGVASPLCSFTYITVNGQDWGLYLAVEGVEESFLQRNYGKDYGELYKPESMNMGGGGNKDGGDKDGGDRGNIPNFDGSDRGNMPNIGGDQGNMPDFVGGQGNMPDFNSSQGNIPNFKDSQQNSDGSSTEQSQTGGNDKQFEIPNNIKNAMGGMGKMNGSDDVLLKYIDDNYDSYSNIFDNAKTKVSNSDKTRLIEALKNLSNMEDLENTVDIEAVIKYFVVHNFVVNFDSYTGSMIHNYYLYENDGQLQMIPWDYNLAFGGFQSSGGATSLVNYPIDSPVSGGNASERPMIAWIFESEEYTNMYHQYFEEFISKYLDSDYFANMIDNVTSMIAPYVEKDPTKFCTYEEFQTGASTLKSFCLLRLESIRGQLEGTIGSTSETQTEDTLIKAEGINIDDMGSMGGNFGGGKGNAFGGENNPFSGESNPFSDDNNPFNGDSNFFNKGNKKSNQGP